MILEVDWGSFIPNVISLVLLTALLVLFVYHADKQNRPVQNLLVSLIWGVIFAILVLIYSLHFMDAEMADKFIKPAYLTALSFQGIFFYLFIENSRKIQPSLASFSFIISLLVIQVLCYWIVPHAVNSGVEHALQFIGDLAFNILPIYAFGVVGIPVYKHMYTYTKEQKPKILGIAVTFVAVGYCFTLIYDFVAFTQGYPDSLGVFFEIIINIGDVLPVIGLVIFMLIYALNISYIYRLPYDHFLLMVTHESGLVLMSMPFETKLKEIDIEENLFSGMLSALKTVYNTVLDAQKPIKMIVNDDVSIYMHAGKYINAVVATNQVSGVLAKGLKIFVDRFEQMFGEQLKDTPMDIKKYESGKDLFMRVFPFLERKKD